MMKIVKIGLWILLALLIFIQFIRPEKNSGEIYTESFICNVVDVPENVEQILRVSCYDCHSDSTVYPWYANVQPVAWWLNDHIKDGKDELNFSTFKKRNLKGQLKKLKEIAKMVEKREMPLESYTYIHKDAILNPQQIKLVADWAKKTYDKLLADSLAKTSKTVEEK